MSAEHETHDLLHKAISLFHEQHGEMTFIQVGGFDGVSFDPLRPKIVEGQMTGLIVEPLPDNFAKLQKLYENSVKVRPVCCAISEEDGERTLYRFSERAFSEYNMNQIFAGISSFILDDLISENGTIGRLWGHGTHETVKSLVEAVQVPCCCFETLLAEQGCDRIDLLLTDTEGYDYNLLKTFNLAKYRPAVVMYESQHLSDEDRIAAEELLSTHGYQVFPAYYDTIAVLPEVITL